MIFIPGKKLQQTFRMVWRILIGSMIAPRILFGHRNNIDSVVYLGLVIPSSSLT